MRLPYTVLPEETASVLANSHDGILAISLKVDKSPPSQQADAGSKPWLLSRALAGGEERNAAAEGREEARRHVGSKPEEKAAAVGDDDVLPEDQFHLKLPKGA